MPHPRWQRIKELFTAAAALPADRRDDFLRAQESDPDVLAEVQSLLGAHSPTVAPGPTNPVAEGPGSRIGPYKLLEIIGEGGFGTVYAADQDAPVRRRVALKVVKAGMDSRAVIARFEQERQALALMDHPNIARVFDGGATPGGRPFFVMELVKGDPITEYCDREKLTPAERLRLFAEVGRAVQHAHQKGVIHRDLKPNNVLVTIVDGKPVAKVIDFGVAKATQGRLTDKTLFTEHKQMIGTPLYMSPEQAHISGVDVDTRSDVYSLGVLLYELLTGTTPFRREELLEAGLAEMHRVLREVDPPKPSTRVATLGPTSGVVAAQRRVEVGKLGVMLRGDLDWIVMKCLEKERARRYETANDLVRDVERHLAGEPVVAAPPSLSYRVRKFVRRKKGHVAAGVAVGVVAAVGVATTLWQAEARALDAQEAAAQQREVADVREFDAYVANIQAADAALRSNDVRTARRRLDACPDHLRGWEWNYLNAASDRSEHVLGGHTGPVVDVAYSPDGARVVTASSDGTAHIWAAATGKQIAALEGTGEPLTGARFSANGEWIAVVSSAGHVAIWDGPGRTRLAKLVAKDAKITKAVFSPDNARLVTLTDSGTSQSWTTATWQIERQLDAGGVYAMTGAVFSSDGTRLVTWTKVLPPRLWDPSTGRQIAVLRGHTHYVNDVSFETGDSRILTASSDGTARFWSSQDGAAGGSFQSSAGITIARMRGVLLKVLSDHRIHLEYEMHEEIGDAHRATIVFAEFVGSSASRWDDARFVTASEDGTARLWQDDSSISLFLGHTDAITTAALSRDCRQLATASNDGTCRLWDLTNTWESRHSLALRGSSGSIVGMAFSPRGDRLAARTSHDCTVIDMQTRRPMATARWEHPMMYGEWSDNDHLVCGPDAHVMDAVTMEARKTIAHKASLRTKAAGSHLLAYDDAGLEVLDLRSGSTLLALRGDLRGDLDSKGSRVAVGRPDGSILVRSIEPGGDDLVLPGRDGPLLELSFSPDGKKLLAASKTGCLRIYDLSTGTDSVLGAGVEPKDPVWSGNGERVATWSPDSIRVFDVLTARTVAVIKPVAGTIRDTVWIFGHAVPYALSPDGSRILVCVADDRATASVWATEGGIELLRLVGHKPDDHLQGAFSPDGTSIATANCKGDLFVWSATPLASQLAAARPLLSEVERQANPAAGNVESAPSPGTGDGSPSTVMTVATQIAKQEHGERLFRAARETRDCMPKLCDGTASTSDITEALTRLRTGLGVAPRDWNLRQMLGIALYRSGAFEASAATLRSLVETSGRESEAVDLSFLVMAMSRQGRRDDATQTLRKLRDFDPDNVACGSFGMTCHDLQEGAKAVFAECFPDAVKGK